MVVLLYPGLDPVDVGRVEEIETEASALWASPGLCSLPTSAPYLHENIEEVILVIVMVCATEEEELQHGLQFDKNLILKEELGKRNILEGILLSFGESKSNGRERFF